MEESACQVPRKEENLGFWLWLHWIYRSTCSVDLKCAFSTYCKRIEIYSTLVYGFYIQRLKLCYSLLYLYILWDFYVHSRDTCEWLEFCFFFSELYHFYFFFLPYCTGWVLNRSGGSRNPCVGLDLKGKVLVLPLSTLSAVSHAHLRNFDLYFFPNDFPKEFCQFYHNLTNTGYYLFLKILFFGCFC